MNLSKNILVMLLILILYSSIIYAETYQIKPSTECTPERTLLKISNSKGESTNAHGEVYNGAGNYPNAVCYMPQAFPQSETIHTCTANNANLLLKLSSTTNAHAEVKTGTLYTTNVCYRNLQCTSVKGNCDATTNGECAVRLSSETNAHISSCSDTNYPISVCCKSSTTTPAETSCNVDSDCQAGYACSQEKCKRTCSTRMDCGPLGQYLCRDGFCDTLRASDKPACLTNDQCEDWQICSSRTCAAKTCNSNDECTGGECDSGTNTCKPKDSGTPGDDVYGGYPTDSTGKNCVFQKDCDNGNICSPETGKCAPSECSEDTDCTTTGETCAKYEKDRGLCLDCSKDTDGDRVNDCDDICPKVPAIGNTESECESNIPSCESLGGVDCTGETSSCLAEEYTTTRSIKCCKPNANDPTEPVCNPGGQYVSSLGTVVSFQKSPCIDEDGDGLGTITVKPIKQDGSTLSIPDLGTLGITAINSNIDGTYTEECTTLPSNYNGPETPFYTYISIFLTLVILGMFYMTRLNRKL